MLFIKTSMAELTAILRQAHRQTPGDIENPEIVIEFGIKGIAVNGEALTKDYERKDKDIFNLDVPGKD